MIKVGQGVVFKTVGDNGVNLHEGQVTDVEFNNKLGKNVFVIQTSYGNFANLTYDEIQYVKN